MWEFFIFSPTTGSLFIISRIRVMRAIMFLHSFNLPLHTFLSIYSLLERLDLSLIPLSVFHVYLIVVRCLMRIIWLSLILKFISAPAFMSYFWQLFVIGVDEYSLMTSNKSSLINIISILNRQLNNCLNLVCLLFRFP